MKGVTVWSLRWAGAAGAAAVAAITLAAVTLSAGAAPAVPAPGVPAQPTPAASAASASPASPAASAASAAPAARQALTGPVVALGDSYTAGEMLPPNLASRPPGCLRSAKAYPALVASALKTALVDAACSGAGVKEMASSQKTYLGTNPPQLSALAPDDGLVLLTLGGDDIGFLNVLHTCMALSITDLGGNPCKNHYASGGRDQLAAKVAAETAKMAAVLGAISTRAPRARIVVVGYPDLFPQSGGCWPRVPITNGDVAYLRGIGTQLNAMLAGTAAAAGATFVDTYTATIGHDVCQSGAAKYVEGLFPTSLAIPFHPNARGQAAMAAQVLAALRARA